MNMRRLSLSVLVVTGLVLGSMPGHAEAAHVNPNRIGLAIFLGLLAIQYRLDSKESVKNPESKYKWSDVFSTHCLEALDDLFIGQKPKAEAVKLAVGEKEVKETSKTPATGICGNGHQFLSTVGKSTVDLGKVLAAPAIFLAIYFKAFKLAEDKGVITAGFDPKFIADIGLGDWIADQGKAGTPKAPEPTV